MRVSQRLQPSPKQPRLQRRCRTTQLFQEHYNISLFYHVNVPSVILGGCEFDIDRPIGEVSSPNYPDYYPSRKDCHWQFNTLPGHRIKLVNSTIPLIYPHCLLFPLTSWISLQVFLDFEVEPHHECTYDNVRLYDGVSERNRSLGRFCGSNGVPDPIISSENHLLMLFYSDASVQRKGFRATHTTGFPVTS